MIDEQIILSTTSASALKSANAKPVNPFITLLLSITSFMDKICFDFPHFEAHEPEHLWQLQTAKAVYSTQIPFSPPPNICTGSRPLPQNQNSV
jgi:hypothetical protein